MKALWPKLTRTCNQCIHSTRSMSMQNPCNALEARLQTCLNHPMVSEGSNRPNWLICPVQATLRCLTVVIRC